MANSQTDQCGQLANFRNSRTANRSHRFWVPDWLHAIEIQTESFNWLNWIEPAAAVERSIGMLLIIDRQSSSKQELLSENFLSENF